LKAYLDASVLVALLTTDPLTGRAVALMKDKAITAIVSDFAKAEVVSAVSRRMRMGEITREEALAVFSRLDFWAAKYAETAETTTADVKRADAMMRGLDSPLRTPDALHIAIAERLRAALATFDDRMAAAARRLGVNAT
jgi:predicted nucleic acid-binding protein